MGTPGSEIAQTHYTASGTSGTMIGAASPMLPENTGGEAQPYTGYFFSHSATALDVADRDRLRFSTKFALGLGFQPADHDAILTHAVGMG